MRCYYWKLCANSYGQVIIGAYPDLFAAGAAFSGVPYGCFAGPSMWNSQCAQGQREFIRLFSIVQRIDERFPLAVIKSAQEWVSLQHLGLHGQRSANTF